mmetsp:Transcript_6222/g.14371  ORF Transcript_6222/g.14371 Transcript_6222/m.14371 type:complete len:214 (-) Transcript_6222:710-1351(-)
MIAQESCQPSYSPWSIGHFDCKIPQSVVSGEPPLDYTSKDCCVDIPATKRNDNILSLQLWSVELTSGQQGRKPSHAATFADQLFVLNQSQNRQADLLFCTRHAFIDVMPRNFKGMCAHHWHGKAICKSCLNLGMDRSSRFQSHVVRCRKLRLDAVYFDVRFECLYRTRYPSNQSCPSNWNNDDLHFRHVLDNLDTNGPGASNYGWVVVPIDVS